MGAVDYVNAGIEGYGWGALSIHLLIHHVMGLHAEEPGKSAIAPALPQALRRIGAIYRVAPVPWGKCVLNIECVVKDGGQTWEWEGVWGEERMVQLPCV